MTEKKSEEEMLRFWLNRAHEYVGGARCLNRSKSRDYTIKAAEEMVSAAERCLEEISDKTGKL